MEIALEESGQPYTDAQSIVGGFRRFGPHGPAYQVLEILPAPPGSEPLARIRVVESSEEMGYALEKLAADP